jgi:hypothetical protein
MLPFGEDGESPEQERERLLCSGVCILGHMGHMGQENMGLYHVLTLSRSLVEGVVTLHEHNLCLKHKLDLGSLFVS